jgi:hypothetical protein
VFTPRCATSFEASNRSTQRLEGYRSRRLIAGRWTQDKTGRRPDPTTPKDVSWANSCGMGMQSQPWQIALSSESMSLACVDVLCKLQIWPIS